MEAVSIQPIKKVLVKLAAMKETADFMLSLLPSENGWQTGRCRAATGCLDIGWISSMRRSTFPVLNVK